MKYENFTSNGSTGMAKVKVFRNVGQMSRSKSQGHEPRSQLKGFHKLSIHSKYEVFLSYGSKVMAKVKFLDM